jgi:hypothetical protein
MHRSRAFVVALIVVAPATAAITVDDADARLRHAYGLARETNDAELVDRLLDLRDRVKAAFERKDLVAAERIVRDAEEAVGLDPGGKSMAGLPVASLTAAEQKTIEGLNEKLAAAMRKRDAANATAVAGEIAKALGDKAGVPDVRRKGDLDRPSPTNPADVAKLFVEVIEADPRALKALTAGVPGPTTMPRAYASVIDGCVAIRPLVTKLVPDKLPELDALVAGCCQAMTRLQTADGFFKFPDLRGKNLRFGDMIDKVAERVPGAVVDGWLVVPDPDGGSQFDAGECGMALLRAGVAYKNDAWLAAGRKAADWAITQPCVPNWNYNAFAVSLLGEAFRATGEKKYLEAARSKFETGVRPGQAANGRWIDPHNARTVYHVILLRACHDLEEALPAGKDRDQAADAGRKAVEALVEEAGKLGAPATGHTVRELSRHLRLHPDAPPAVQRVLEQAATAAVRKCTAGSRVRAAVPLPELAALAGVGQ